MKNLVLISAFLFLIASCKSDKTTDQAASEEMHTVVVEEVLQTSQYTYLRVKEGEKETWLATPKMQAAAGETYYYKSGLPMTNFESKELNRTFENILFLDNISNSPAGTAAVAPQEATGMEQGSVDPGASAAGTESGQVVDPNILHTVVVEEVLQSKQYTYLRTKEAGKEVWIAVSRMDAKVGATYYFRGGLPMADFASKELKRTFAEILFVDNISETPSAAEAPAQVVTQTGKAVSTGSSISLEKMEVKITHAKDDITIASLYENKNKYADKSIKLNGQVTKFNAGIMKKNWIHLQDGTDSKGKFDLVVTTDQEVKVGDIITVEGVIHLEKDFGFGYYYDVIMEDAKIIK